MVCAPNPFGTRDSWEGRFSSSMALNPLKPAQAARPQDAAATKAMFDLAGSVALVTGGGRGIGRACALALARQGADVAVVSWGHPGSADETIRHVRALGRRGHAVVANVADARSAQSMVQDVVGEMGRLDVLVNNAGIVSTTPFVSLSEAEWDNVVNVDLKGQFLVAQAA